MTQERRSPCANRIWSTFKQYPTSMNCRPLSPSKPGGHGVLGAFNIAESADSAGLLLYCCTRTARGGTAHAGRRPVCRHEDYGSAYRHHEGYGNGLPRRKIRRTPILIGQNVPSGHITSVSRHILPKNLSIDKQITKHCLRPLLKTPKTAVVSSTLVNLVRSSLYCYLGV